MNFIRDNNLRIGDKRRVGYDGRSCVDVNDQEVDEYRYQEIVTLIRPSETTQECWVVEHADGQLRSFSRIFLQELLEDAYEVCE